ncbi:hypothetical protein HPULCUR_010621 [Helicostylum pulchrum]|uniref:Uncharacterized protein n=1 Tax=Helicostylum pulchrum TaxID=562976 RepID=A0ABP9YDS2_9FUNG
MEDRVRVQGERMLNLLREIEAEEGERGREVMVDALMHAIHRFPIHRNLNDGCLYVFGRDRRTRRCHGGLDDLLQQIELALAEASGFIPREQTVAGWEGEERTSFVDVYYHLSWDVRERNTIRAIMAAARAVYGLVSTRGPVMLVHPEWFDLRLLINNRRTRVIREQLMGQEDILMLSRAV